MHNASNDAKIDKNKKPYVEVSKVCISTVTFIDQSLLSEGGKTVNAFPLDRK